MSSQHLKKVVQVRAPHCGRIAKVGAVAACVKVPSVWPMGAVAKVPSPPRSGQIVERQQADVAKAAGREHLVEDTVAGVHIEILRGLRWAARYVSMPLYIRSQRGDRVYWALDRGDRDVGGD